MRRRGRRRKVDEAAGSARHTVSRKRTSLHPPASMQGAAVGARPLESPADPAIMGKEGSARGTAGDRLVSALGR